MNASTPLWWQPTDHCTVAWTQSWTVSWTQSWEHGGLAPLPPVISSVAPQRRNQQPKPTEAARPVSLKTAEPGTGRESLPNASASEDIAEDSEHETYLSECLLRRVSLGRPRARRP